MTLRRQMRAGRDEADESVKSAAIANSLIGNLHTWYAVINGGLGRRATNQKEAKKREMEKKGTEYPIGRLMSMVRGLENMVKELR